MMQPDELKAVRAALSMTQQAFADALGMSRKAVNEMEKGSARIERRTAAAVGVLAQLVEARGHARRGLALAEAGGAISSALVAEARAQLERLDAVIGGGGGR